MNVQGLCASGAADGAKIRRLVKLAEREGVVVVAVQESWFKKQRNEDEMVQAVAGTDWRWFGARREKQKRKDKKGSGGVGFLVHGSAGRVKMHPGSVNGVMWLELDVGGETTHVINLYLVPAAAARPHIHSLEGLSHPTLQSFRFHRLSYLGRIGAKEVFCSVGKSETLTHRDGLPTRPLAPCNRARCRRSCTRLASCQTSRIFMTSTSLSSSDLG